MSQTSNHFTPASPTDAHDFDVTFTIDNTSPVSVSDVTLTWQLPSGVSAAGGAGTSGSLVTQSFASFSPNSEQNVTVALKANIGLTMNTGTDSHLTYEYENSMLTGVISAKAITVREDITTNYEIPVVIAVVIALVAIAYMRRDVAPAVMPSPTTSSPT